MQQLGEFLWSPIVHPALQIWAAVRHTFLGTAILQPIRAHWASSGTTVSPANTWHSCPNHAVGTAPGDIAPHANGTPPQSCDPPPTASSVFPVGSIPHCTCEHSAGCPALDRGSGAHAKLDQCPRVVDANVIKSIIDNARTGVRTITNLALVKKGGGPAAKETVSEFGPIVSRGGGCGLVCQMQEEARRA